MSHQTTKSEQKNEFEGLKPGDVTSLETRWIVECANDDGDWYDFGVYLSMTIARAKIAEFRKYRPATYRIVRRKIMDVLLKD